MSTDFSLLPLQTTTPPSLEPAPDRLPTPSPADSESSNPSSPLPPSFIHVTFHHPLHNERGYTITTILRTFSRHLRSLSLAPCTSLLDLGCGEGSFLTRLILPDDDLPVQNVTGIDPSDDVEDPGLHKALSPGGYANFSGEAWERWAPLKFSLYRGSFEALKGGKCYHDVVVCTEVVEHLDPGPLEKWGDVVLGDVNPRICVVTTPNREFNALFDILEQKQPDMPPGARYRWPGVEYQCRHDDHRFEWTRREFRSWACELAERWGYEVIFGGVGGWGRGMGLANVDDIAGELKKLALEVAGGEPEPLSKEYSPTELGNMFEDIRIDEDKDIINRVFGNCTQLAVFIRKPINSDAGIYTALTETPSLRRTFTTTHPFTPDEQFPPALSALLPHIITHRTLRCFLPSLFDALWSLTTEEYTKVLEGNTRSLFTRCGEFEKEKRNRLMAKCAAKPCQVTVVETTVGLGEWWGLVNGGGPGAGRGCRWREDVWFQVMTSEGPQYHKLTPSPPPEESEDPYANPPAWQRYRPHTVRNARTPTPDTPVFHGPIDDEDDYKDYDDDVADIASDISPRPSSPSQYSRYSDIASLAAWSDIPPVTPVELVTEVVWAGGAFASDEWDAKEGLLTVDEKKDLKQEEVVRLRFYRPEGFNEEKIAEVKEEWRRREDTVEMMEELEIEGLRDAAGKGEETGGWDSPQGWDRTGGW